MEIETDKCKIKRLRIRPGDFSSEHNSERVHLLTTVKSTPWWRGSHGLIRGTPALKNSVNLGFAQK